ncbi:putative GTP cyclohydrolase II [Trypanosoma grayi]|uniref:putative GTP cyclohydrolase II n=1 Tax=Trypanosoma grayi TaxID=71804 RepID=UPI0004F464C0|nr:putative GTP cyclohydrolase II [Trypanosoma grayi]KEG08107.1 putative GTP cyclohydrolase II [Trypanosoma grayi]
MSKSVVRFHDVHDTPYGAFSPLSPHPIVVRHKQYPSLHHYFLTERFRGSPLEEALQSASSVWELDRLVKEAERIGCQREDWNRVKVDVMLLGNYMKFKQNDGVRNMLLDTGDKLIVDHTPADDFWGDRGDGTGRNLLGVILMAVRDRLQRESSTKARNR